MRMMRVRIVCGTLLAVHLIGFVDVPLTAAAQSFQWVAEKEAKPTLPPDTKPYDPQLMRLAEILGALTYMRGLCGDKDADAWRLRMQALMNAEGTSRIRKERLAGAYNKGLDSYSLSYRTCTANAHLVIQRFLAEGERIAKDVETRYRAS